MRYFYLVLFFLILGYFILFSILNDTLVAIDLYFFNIQGITVGYSLIGALVIGMIISFLLQIPLLFRKKRKTSKKIIILKTFIFLLSSSPFLLKKTLLSRLSHIQFKFPKYIELKDYYESQGFNFREEDFDLVKGLNLSKLTEKNLNEARENWAEFINDLSELSSYKEIEKVVSKWDNELIQEKLIWLSRILINSFGSKLKIKSSSVRFNVDSFEMKSLIELSEVFKTIQEILIDLNSGIKLNNKVQLKSLLMSLN